MNFLETIIGQKLRNAQEISVDLIWKKVFNDANLKEIILNYIKQDQLFEKGVNENDKIIGLYSKMTERLSNGKKKEGTPYTLFDTGEFYESINYLVGYKLINITADPIKIDEDGETTNLFEKYGEGIIGLTTSSKEKLAIEIQKRFIVELRKLL